MLHLRPDVGRERTGTKGVPLLQRVSKVARPFPFLEVCGRQHGVEPHRIKVGHRNRVATRLERLAHRVAHGGHEGVRLRVGMDEVDAHGCCPGPLKRASEHPW